MHLYQTPRILPLLFPRLTWRVHTEAPVVHLTFDDGPMPGPTDFVLDQLAGHQAQATFFCIGDNVRKHRETFLRIRQEGHLPANHTYHHLNGWKTGSRRYIENIRHCDDIMDMRVGEPRLFRPPYGRLNPFTRSAASSLSGWQMDHRIIMWDLLSCDYDPQLDVAESLQALKSGTRPGSIVVFHDSLKAEKNLRYLLPRYLEFLSASGYRMKTIPTGA